MSQWNYRLISHPDKCTDSGRWLQIHEVYYDDKGKIAMWTENSPPLGGETKAEVLEGLKMIKKDITKSPVLMIEELEATAQKLQKKKRTKRND